MKKGFPITMRLVRWFGLKKNKSVRKSGNDSVFWKSSAEFTEKNRSLKHKTRDHKGSQSDQWKYNGWFSSKRFVMDPASRRDVPLHHFMILTFLLTVSPATSAPSLRLRVHPRCRFYCLSTQRREGCAESAEPQKNMDFLYFQWFFFDSPLRLC